MKNLISKNSPVDIAYSTDDYGVEMLITSIFSIMTNNQGSKINIHIIESGLSRKNRAKIDRLHNNFKGLTINYLKVNPTEFKHFRLSQSWITQQAYYRYLLPNLLLEKTKVLYLDIDILCRSNINELWRVDLKNNYVAAAPSYFIESNKEPFIGYKRAIGMKRNEHYFNSGVLLINLEKMRIDGMVEKFLFNAHENRRAIIKENDDIFVDQTVANLTFRSGVHLLSYKWNALVHNHQQTHRQAPVLLHFAGGHKPFNYADQHPVIVQYMDEYTDYYVKSMGVVNRDDMPADNNRMLIRKILNLHDLVSQKHNEIVDLRSENESIQSSVSWRITKPLRRLNRYASKLRRFVYR